MPASLVEHFQNITGLTFAPALLGLFGNLCSTPFCPSGGSPAYRPTPALRTWRPQGCPTCRSTHHHGPRVRRIHRSTRRCRPRCGRECRCIRSHSVALVPSSHFGRIGAAAILLRKEACSGGIDDLAHNPTQKCLADCLTKASAKANNLITAVKRGRLLDVDIHFHFRTLMEHKAFLSTLCRTFLHTRDKEVFFLNSLEISLAPTLQERPFQVMFATIQQTKEQK